MNTKRRLEKLEQAAQPQKPGMKKVINWLPDDRMVVTWEPLDPDDKPGVTVNWEPPQESEQ